MKHVIAIQKTAEYIENYFYLKTSILKKLAAVFISINTTDYDSNEKIAASLVPHRMHKKLNRDDGLHIT